MTTNYVVKKPKTNKLKEPMIDYYPTGSEVFFVRGILENYSEAIMKEEELKKKVKDKVSKEHLEQILKYLQYTNQIIYSKKGITYIHPASKKLKDIIKKGIVYGRN
jgi:hypothetical protein